MAGAVRVVGRGRGAGFVGGGTVGLSVGEGTVVTVAGIGETFVLVGRWVAVVAYLGGIVEMMLVAGSFVVVCELAFVLDTCVLEIGENNL